MFSHRVIDIASVPARLRVRHEQLSIQAGDEPAVLVPLAELAVLAVAHPAVSFTHAVISGLARHGGVLITSDESGMPVAMLLPLQAHHTQSERFAAQASAKLPVNKRLWQQIVRSKIEAQASLLIRLWGDDLGLKQMIRQVRSGDPQNLEAQASRRYWSVLFGDIDFRRQRMASDANRLLNYGYAVLRAIVARALCGAGLHPCLGLHHHNRYDQFCLASDLMEPFRPIVDAAVVQIVSRDGPDVPLDAPRKRTLVESLTSGRHWPEGARTIFESASRAASSLAQVYLGEAERLDLPQGQPSWLTIN